MGKEKGTVTEKEKEGRAMTKTSEKWEGRNRKLKRG